MSGGGGALAPRDYQIEAIDAIEGALQRGLRRPAAVMATGLGKGHPADTLVPTPNGMRRWGDLNDGDLVFGSTGAPVKVLAVYERGTLPTYRVTLSDGAAVEVDGDHLWAVRTKDDKAHGRAYRSLATASLANRLDRGWYVPMCGPVEHDRREFVIDPYVMGVLLGDGGLSIDGRVLITCQRDTADLMRELLPDGVTLAELADAGGGAATWLVGAGAGRGANPVMDALRGYGLMGRVAAGKFVPEEYLRGSVEQRAALLQGLCDTDGYVAPSAGWVEYTTVSRALADDVAELVTSLGGKAEVKARKTTWTHNGERRTGNAFRLNIRPGAAAPLPVRVARKASQFVRATKYLPTRKIVSIEPIGDRSISCIMVDAPDQLYVVTRDHVVTHNTVVFAHLARRRLLRAREEGLRPGATRVLVLAHRTELITQAASKIKSVAPDLRVGVVQAGRNETLSDVIVASVQTLAGERRRRMLTNVGMIIVDECHHSVAESYRKVLREFGALPVAPGDPAARGDAVAVGFTATMTRGDRAALGSVWQDVVFTRDYAFGVANGWLVRPKCVYVRVDDLDLSTVKQTRGDYQAADLGEAIETSMAPAAIVKAMREHAILEDGSVRPTILFAPLVHTAELIRDALRAEGFTAEVVSAGTPADVRKCVLEDYAARRVQVLCNAMVFTEGTDLPLTSCIVVARPTRNRGLFIQMVGRGGRPAPGKTDMLVLDVVGASLRNSLTLPVELFGEGETVNEREPCDCPMWPDREACRCGRRCLKTCMCGGGAACGCPRPDVVDGDLVGFEDIGIDLDDPSWANGALVAEEVDLFHGSHSAWMRTNAGVWFLDCGERYLAIVRDGGGGLDVVSVGRESGSRWVARGVGELSYAMAWAEGDLTSVERGLANREVKWRARKPSDAQKATARRWGVRVEDGMLSGEVSNRITVAAASWRIDPKLKPWMV